jgi:parvulin-like peptidyl-prolyl isomerase
MRRPFAACLLAIMACAASALAEPRPVDWIVAVVDADIITFTQFVEEMRVAAAKGGHNLESLSAEDKQTLADQVLEKLVTDALLVQEARRMGITVTPAEIDQTTDESLERLRSQFVDENAYQRALASEFTTPDRMRERYRATTEGQLLRNKLIDRQVRRKIKVTDSDILEAYQGRGEEVRVRHILVSDSGIALDVREKLLSGGDFDAIGREAQAIEAADLGWVRRGTLVKPFEDAAYALRPNEISGVVRTRYGFHVIQLLERRSTELPVLSDDLRERIFTELYSTSFDQLFEAYMDDLEDRAYVEYREDSIKPVF